MAEFKALTYEELFQNIKAINWQDYIDENGEFPISWVSSVKSKLYSKSDIQRISKKAIVENTSKQITSTMDIRNEDFYNGPKKEVKVEKKVVEVPAEMKEKFDSDSLYMKRKSVRAAHFSALSSSLVSLASSVVIALVIPITILQSRRNLPSYIP